LVVDEHRQYLRDPVRLESFSRAIQATVRPGSVVLDLASGSGILGLLACRAGAARVFSVEEGGMIEVARQVAKDNGYADRITFIKGHSRHVTLPERVDVVVADQVGNFGFNAGVIEYFADARRRFLKPDGVTIPRRMDLWSGPVECPEFFAQVDFWKSSPAGFDFSGVRHLAANTGYQVDLAASSALGDPVPLVSIDLNDATTALLRGKTRATIGRRGTLHGLGGWFDVELSDGIQMTNSPLSPRRIDRRQVFLPIDQPVPVAVGDFVDVNVLIRPQDRLVNWVVEVLDGRTSARKGRFRHSTWHGMLHNREDLDRTRPDSVPRLNARGEARRTVVNLCDGMRTVRELEDDVWERHSDLFGSPAEASEFVAEVITRYAT